MVDGTDIREMSQESLREAIGYVPQKVFCSRERLLQIYDMEKKMQQKSRLWMQPVLHRQKRSLTERKVD